MPTPRKGETLEECRTRNNARKREWRTIRRSQFVDAEGNRLSASYVQVPAREEYKPLPAALLRRRSTLVDAEGAVVQAWHIEAPEDTQRLAAWKAAAQALAETLPTLPTMPFEYARVNFPGLMTVYPIGDHHTGMLAWKHETGESYDMEIAERLLVDATRYLVAGAQPSQRAAVVFLGDFMHYDSFAAVTPEHKNLLDADGRFSRLVGVAMRLARRTIELAAEKHANVDVIFSSGNHDPASMTWMRTAMATLYENTPRIRVDTSPKHFHYLEFGRNLIGVHHGHGKVAKAGDLAGIMAYDQGEAWGRTKHRWWLRGHTHHEAIEEHHGVRVETFGILAPADAYAAHEGYRSNRSMKAITLHHEYGEVARHTVNPGMLVD
jgi:hypothetical protein